VKIPHKECDNDADWAMHHMLSYNDTAVVWVSLLKTGVYFLCRAFAVFA